MINGETSYLYSDKSKDLYANFLEESAGGSCYFTRYVTLYHDNKDNEGLSFFHKHLIECPICQSSLRKLEKEYTAAVKKIPITSAHTYFRENVSSHLEEVFNILEQRAVDRKRLARLERSGHLRKVLFDTFVAPFISKTFAYGVIYALASFIFLAWLS